MGLESLDYCKSINSIHPVIKALLSCQPEDFYTREIAARRQYHLPPMGVLPL
ncbi:hypothetical protein [Bartonella elizabethae]|uniref:hypothetical protein n=1 Tax=Bartonella elizabethae TaxID=807 RepID=UPI001AEBBAB4|nr:hypothetical protein [Bartonella elizabethae]